MAHIRVTDIIGPKKQPTDMVLQVKIPISLYVELDRIASGRSSVDDVVNEALCLYVASK